MTSVSPPDVGELLLRSPGGFPRPSSRIASMLYDTAHARREAASGNHSGLRLEPFQGVFRNPADPGGAARFIATSTQVARAADAPSGAVAGHGLHQVLGLALPSGGSDYVDSGRLMRSWLSSGFLLTGDRPALYVHEEKSADGKLQRGLIGALRVGPPTTSAVYPHEDVLPHVVDRCRNMLRGLRADLEPLTLRYHGEGAASDVVDLTTEQPPLLEAATECGALHRVWELTAPDGLETVRHELARSRAVIADGHHRFSAQLALRDLQRAAGETPGFWEHGLALLVDSRRYPLSPAAFHRVVHGVPLGAAVDRLLPDYPLEPCEGTLSDALGLLAARRSGSVALLSDGDRHHLVGLARARPATAYPGRPTDVELIVGGLLPDAVGEAAAANAACVDSVPNAIATAAASGGFAVLLNPLDESAIWAAATDGRRLPKKSTNFPLKPPLGLVMRMDPHRSSS